MHVRHMTSDDLHATAALVLSNAVFSYTSADTAGLEGASPDTLSADMARLHSESFVALSDDKTVTGYAYARIRRGVLWLDRLLVSEEAGDECAGSLLHAVIINYVGDPAISVAIATDDNRLSRFYEEQGFVFVDHAEDALVLRRLIART